MPQVSGKRSGSGNGSNNSSKYNPRDEGYDADQADEIEQFEAPGRRFRDELRNK